jgi:hypothetical protein
MLLKKGHAKSLQESHRAGAQSQGYSLGRSAQQKIAALLVARVKSVCCLQDTLFMQTINNVLETFEF